jgi:hypothetical protein
MNARIGNSAIPKLIGHYGERVINANGRELRDFCASNNLRITNTLYRHKEIHRCTGTDRGTRSIIDYIISNEKVWPYIQDTRSYRGAEADTDHYSV